MTLAILARDHETGTFGVAVATSTPAAGGLDGIAHVPRFGLCLGIAVPGRCHKVGAAMLQSGLDAAQSLAAMVGADSAIAYRQLGVLDCTGAVAGYTGAQCVPHASHKSGSDYLVLGNWLAGYHVTEALERGFLESKGQTFVRRLIAALEAGRDAGGEISDPLLSALVVAFGDREGFHRFDFRVDLAEDPVSGLLKIHDHAAQQMPAVELARDEPGTLWADASQGT